MVLALPFVDQVWQIYVLIFILQAASAGFTSAFPATIREVPPQEDDYTRALSLMRLAEDTEQIASPLIAAALLTRVSFPLLPAGTVSGFLLPALLVGTSRLPPRQTPGDEPFLAAATKGLRVYAATPRLRGLLALEAAVASAGAMVYVNTVVLVEVRLALGGPQVALAFAAFGAGPMLAAVAAVPLTATLSALLVIWSVAGFGFSLTQTPIGRILNRSAAEPDRPALFAAQFALGHACWLITCPLADWLGALAGLGSVAPALAGAGTLALLLTRALWPADDPGTLPHAHPDLPARHPHRAGHGHGTSHSHRVVIDDLHRTWPGPAR